MNTHTHALLSYMEMCFIQLSTVSCKWIFQHKYIPTVIILKMSKDSLQNPMHQLFRDYCWNSYIIVAVLRDRCEMDLSTESHDREKEM